jgi:hypothetical protein
MLELPSKNARLHVARRILVVIIEAHFAPRNHARIAGQRIELREMIVGGNASVVRMDADCPVDPIVLLGERNRGVDPLRRTGPAADGEKRLHARGARAFEHRVAVFVEWRAFEVRVRVNNLHV